MVKVSCNRIKRAVCLVIIFVFCFVLMLTGCGEAEITDIDMHPTTNEERGDKDVQPQGTIWRLDEAYEEGLISTEHLQSIAYYYNFWLQDDSDFVPIPKYPEELSNETILKIRKTYYYIRDGYNKGAALYNVRVCDYYGTYDGYAVVDISGGGCDSPIGGLPYSCEEYEIGGVVFYWYSTLFVWKAFD